MPKTPTGIFCRSCGYDLRSLGENRCPECGRDFDPGQRRTYDLRPRRGTTARWIWRIGILTTLAILALAGDIAYTWRGWQRDQQAYARLRKFGIIRQEPAAMPVIEHLLPQRYQYLRTRVWSVCVNSDKFTQEDWDLLPRLAYLRDARLGRVARDEAILRCVESLKDLTYLSINSKSTDDHFVGRLVANMPRIQNLSLWGGSISDAGVKEINTLTALQWLGIGGDEITDVGLLSLANMPSLRKVSLFSASQVSDEAIAKFKALRPDVEINRL